MTKYRCLVLDHDDTTVDSTRHVNYPQFKQFIHTLRPEVNFTEEDYIRNCCDYGFYGMCDQLFHYTPEELELHIANWKAYLKTHKAPFFPGIPELIQRQKDEGGLVCVVSHSYEDTIRPLYDHFGVVQPDTVFGAERPEEERKPNAWPLLEIMHRYDLSPEEVLMVDDAPHLDGSYAPQGGELARKCGVTFACAAWFGMPQHVKNRMQNSCDFFLETVSQLETLLFG